ncbi:nuclear transport factor 2 family protein [Thioalkalivibrio sp. XN8]|uniref:YybH family protein n=1 Tax=Thioalkalivibrio sp. XN8 TaxID=2712863 RepID=UPI0013ED0B50|nr:nuclear transport factor 2 family protein [Thioalkalivibrio sp. XN8]NGP54336.1 hypothetical protein [Thioalkalivibrio sp. XN8]
MNLTARGLGLTLFCLVLAGCATRSACVPAPYMDARSRAPLAIPSGLDTPEQRGALRVPAAGSMGGRLANDPGNCIIEPPSFHAAMSASPGSALPRQSGAGAGVALTGTEAEVAAFIERWAELWSRRDADSWLALYIQDYAAVGYPDAAAWRAEQRQRFEIPASTRVDLATLEVEQGADSMVRARFVQRFGVAPAERAVRKELVLFPSDGGNWLIIDERVLEVL